MKVEFNTSLTTDSKTKVTASQQKTGAATVVPFPGITQFGKVFYPLVISVYSKTTSIETKVGFNAVGITHGHLTGNFNAVS